MTHKDKEIYLESAHISWGTKVQKGGSKTPLMFVRKWLFSLFLPQNKFEWSQIWYHCEGLENSFTDWGDTSPNSFRIARYGHFSARDEGRASGAHLGATVMAPRHHQGGAWLLWRYHAIFLHLWKKKKKEEIERETRKLRDKPPKKT